MYSEESLNMELINNGKSFTIKHPDYEVTFDKSEIGKTVFIEDGDLVIKDESILKQIKDQIGDELPLQHTFENHDKCEIDHCQICEGGLSYCTTCHGAESSLSTHCTGEHLTEHDQIYISNGDDFKDGKWHRIDIYG